jgi:hypothetical protein
MSDLTAPAAVAAPATAPLLVNGLLLTKNTAAIQALGALPAVRAAILRPRRAFKMGQALSQEGLVRSGT